MEVQNAQRKKIFCAGLILTFMCMCTGCPGAMSRGEPDRLGSWGSINQDITRGEDWQQIVTDSAFPIGRKMLLTDPYGEQYHEISFGNYPRLDGSTVAVPMAIEFARQHLGLSDQDAADFVSFSTTHAAYERLIYKYGGHGDYNPMGAPMNTKHPVDLIIATAPSEDERKMARETNTELVQVPVCWDAFVFITHRDNPVSSLTQEQIRGIYSGEITSWEEVGGRKQKIAAYQREENSGSQTAMLELVMRDTPMLPPEKIVAVEGMSGMIELVAEYQNSTASIGYTYKYYIDTLYKNEDIKILAVDGVEPTVENIRSQAYPYSTQYYGVIREADMDKTGGAFLQWMLSPEGQACIRQAGYIPCADGQEKTQ